MASWIAPISLLILFEGIADIFAKEYSISGHPWIWVTALGGYIVANVFWLYAIRDGSGLARGGTIFAIVSEIIAVILGLLFFKERLSGLQLAGIVLGIVSVAMIVW